MDGWRAYLNLAGGLAVAVVAAAWLLPGYRSLALLFFYSIPANSVVPVPHEPAMMWFGRSYHPFLVALVAALGTCLACFPDYRAVNLAFRSRRIQGIRDSDAYQGAVSLFLKAPFFCVLVAAFAPFIPFYIFRVLSPSSGYPLRRYTTAVFFGRLPRYYLFALLGTALTIPNLILVGGGILVVCTYVCTRVKRHMAGRAPQAAAAAPPMPSREPLGTPDAVTFGPAD
jgi:membrane protein YqaA with SNARE-associated domain